MRHPYHGPDTQPATARTVPPLVSSALSLSSMRFQRGRSSSVKRPWARDSARLNGSSSACAGAAKAAVMQAANAIFRFRMSTPINEETVSPRLFPMSRHALAAAIASVAAAPLALFAATIDAQVRDAAGNGLSDAAVYAIPAAGGFDARPGRPAIAIEQIDREFVPY